MDISFESVVTALKIVGLSAVLAVTVFVALIDPEPVTKLGLVGLSAAQIALLLSLFGIEDKTSETKVDA